MKKAQVTNSPSSSAISVRTVFGTRFLDPNQSVLAELSPGIYVPRRVSDLLVDQRILYGKEGAHVKIEDVEIALARSDRYVACRPVLFKELPDGSFTTQFAYHLLSGFSDEKGDSLVPAAVKVKVQFANGKPILSDTEARDISLFIHEHLTRDTGSSPTMDHIRHGWLAGNVIAPRDLDRVVSSLQKISPDLDLMLSGGFQDAYRLYVRIRQTVMGQLSALLEGKGANSTKEATSVAAEGSIKIAPELKLVADHFAAFVSTNYVVTPAVEIKVLFGNEAADQIQKSDKGTFFSGVITTAKKPAVETIDISKVSLYEGVSNIVTVRLMAEFVYGYLGHSLDTPIGMLLTDGIFGYFGAAAKQRALFRSNLARLSILFPDLDIPRIFRIGLDNIPAMEKSLADKFIAETVCGKLDLALGLDRGRLVAFFETYSNLMFLPPADLTYLELLLDAISFFTKRRLFDAAAKARLEHQTIKGRLEKRHPSLQTLGAQVPTFLRATMYNDANSRLILSGKASAAYLIEQEGRRLSGSVEKSDSACLAALDELGFSDFKPFFIKGDDIVSITTRPLDIFER